MTDSNSQTELRLAAVLERAVAREGSFNALELAITKANALLRSDGSAVDSSDVEAAPARCKRFDRRKIKDIVEGKTNVPITFDQLKMLDNYLIPFGESLSHKPLFERPDVLTLLASKRQVEFLLCARDDTVNKRTSMSDNDVLAMTELQRKISQMSSFTRLGLRDVIVSTDRKQVLSELDFVGQGLFDRNGPSLVAIGAPRVCSPAERMLGLMFDCPEWTPQPFRMLPFHFVWPKAHESPLPSSFDLPWQKIPHHFKGAKKSVVEGARALVWHDGIQLDEPPDWNRSRDVGVIALQQRAGGELWVCLAGLSGIGTYACALMLDKLARRVPQPADPKQHGDVLWAVVEVRLAQRNLARPGLAIRRMLDPCFVSPPRIWERTQRRVAPN
jgi:hypothetical protein